MNHEKIKKAKENWLSTLCLEIEGLEKKHDSYNVHKNVKGSRADTENS